VAAISEPARRRLRQVLPAAASAGGEQGVAALIARVVQSESAGLLPVLPATRLPVPVTAVVLDQPETVRGDLRLCQDGEVAPDDNAGGDRHGHHQ
jgi:hypothetical protein